MTIDIISTDKAPAAIGPYVQGKIAGDFLFALAKFHWILKQGKSLVVRSQSKQSKSLKTLKHYLMLQKRMLTML